MAEAPKIEIEVKYLRAAMKDIAGVVESKNTIPVLANVLLRARENGLTLLATDLDLLVERHVDVQKAKAFTATVHAATLEKIAAKLPEEAVASLVLDGGTLHVSAGRAKFKLPTLPADDFPVMVAPEWPHLFEMAPGLLQQMIDRVRFAISSEEARYYLCGIFLHHHQGSDMLASAATDGHRLAVHRMDVPDGAAGIPDIIIPAKTVKVVDKLLDTAEAPVEVAIAVGKIRFATGQVTLTSKLIDGQYPDYERVVPSGNDKRVCLDPAKLAEAADRVMTVSTDKTRAVKMSVHSDRLTLEVSSPENGQGVEEVDTAELGDGDGLQLGFNGRYLLDVLGHLTNDRAEALLADPAAPSLWRDGPDARSIYVLMPMRV